MGADMGARALAAARAMVGVPFRRQGCDPATGLDCVGLVWAAFAAAGRALARPADYPMRGWSAERIAAALRAAGFQPVRAERRDGDVALIADAAGQFHLAMIGQDIVVHAHAGLRRVVESPPTVVPDAATRWRLFE
ncbi:MAG: NlpC/P60 family protein [Sphingopyxis sp.]|uniref:NlpC/P60 family protein n=1 Tax=Sphingopyxis sp. TaxID=1908224 RepID=UPI002ABC579D|nr:NlpC/P60 family protein [Sphingopyxis sp.]MDZ3830333.1 NlpC/P60 family protein [Sphingopyxis sp.]